MKKIEERKLTKEEKLGYLNGICEDIFQKPYGTITPEEKVTLGVNLIARTRIVRGTLKISDELYNQLKEELN